MARYDPDLIAALAAGQFPPEEATALEREIAGDPRAAADLAAQRLALEALHRAPAPILSAEERTELRRRVAAALNLEEGTVARVVSVRRRVPWRPLAVAAAALAVIAAIVPLTGLLSVGGDEVAMTTTAQAEIAARNGAEEAAPDVAENYSDDGDLTAGLLGTQSYSPDPARAAEEMLADPSALLSSSAEGLALCDDEAAALLGENERLAAARLPLAEGEAVVWFLSPDGISLEKLAIFDAADCRLLAGPLPDPRP